MIVHNITTIVTELLNVDEQGNVTERKRGEQSINKLSKEEFVLAYEQILKFKDDWNEQCQA